MRWTKVVALSAIGALSLAACGGNTNNGDANKPGGAGGSGAFQDANDTAVDMTAKGPAPAIPGVKKGGTLTVQSAGAPETFDPSAQYYQDVNVIDQLLIRKLTTYQIRDGKSVLVPDIAESWEESADKLSWTFKLKKGIKYEDGTEVKAADFVYGIKRSFAQEELPGGPVYQIEYLKGVSTEKDGTVTQTYMGPYKDKNKKFEGAEAVDDYTLKINLAKPWPTLPYYASFTQMSPIPEAKDTKLEYANHPLSTGPYKFDKYSKGTSLTLVKNDKWDAATDAARYQNVDKYEFKFAGDTTVIAKSIMASANDADAASLSYDGIPAEVYDDAVGAKKDQVVTGTGPCVSYVGMDTDKIKDINVRKAIAAAYPLESIRKAGSVTTFEYEPASTYMVPTVPGFKKYEPLEFLNGKGNGDPDKAKQMLKDAGAENFELSFYYAQDNPMAVKTMTATKQGFEDAGFKVKAIGKPRKEVRKLRNDPKQPVNLMQGASGWCFDWPSGDSVYPPIFASLAKNSGMSVGGLHDAEVDKKMADIKALPLTEQGAKWSEFDKWLMENKLPAIPTSYSKGAIIFGKKVKNVENDPNQGMPSLSAVYIDQ